MTILPATSTPPSGSAEPEYYGSTTRHYDAASAAYVAVSRLQDIPFYVEVAKSVRGSVLEVACGTGRVLLPTARAGERIDGLDLSPDLLSILRGKLNSEPQELQDRVSIYQGDMRDFSLGKTYDLVTVPFRSLQHLFTVDDQLAAFKSIGKHLGSGGKLAFNVFYPNFLLLDHLGVEKPDLEWIDHQDSSVTVQRAFRLTSLDKLNQFFDVEFTFRSYRGEQLVNEERSTLSFSFYTYPQVLLLLKSTGFKIKEEYGSYEKEPISVRNEMIFIAEKE